MWSLTFFKRVLMYEPLICIGYIRDIQGVPFIAPILREHVSILRQNGGVKPGNSETLNPHIALNPEVKIKGGLGV